MIPTKWRSHTYIIIPVQITIIITVNEINIYCNGFVDSLYSIYIWNIYRLTITKYIGQIYYRYSIQFLLQNKCHLVCMSITRTRVRTYTNGQTFPPWKGKHYQSSHFIHFNLTIIIIHFISFRFICKSLNGKYIT